MRNIEILDCTLRDGGFCLEDVSKNFKKNEFNRCDIQMLTNTLVKSNIDIIEIGSIEKTDKDKSKFAIYENIEKISKESVQKNDKKQMFAALYRGPDTPVDEIPMWTPKLCEVVRVIIRYSELKKSLDFCKSLSEKGYKVFIQPMLTLRYSHDELLLVMNEANKMKASALYIVDSYGYMSPSDIERLVNIYDKGLDKNIKIGFHSHNNMNLSFSNTIAFINCSKNRDIIIDSCILGMGQGAGNLQTELIIPYLNDIYKERYEYNYILDACEITEKYLENSLWGYSVSRLLPAIHKVAYKYSVILRDKYNLKYRDINYILSNIPEELKHRYTLDNTIKLLEKLGFEQYLNSEEY